MFNFGKGYGIWIGLCEALKINVEYVSPQKWKSRLIKGKDKSKQASINRVLELFPDIDLRPGRLIKDHDGMAEALLIAIYGGMVKWT